MKKFIFYIMVISIIFPELSWGEDPYDATLKYVPRTVVTGDPATLPDPSGDIDRYRYNPIENQWKVLANKCTIKYNPMENKWTYVYPGEVLRFNPADNDWDYKAIEHRLKYDIIVEKWFYGYPEHPGALTWSSPSP